MRLPQGPRCVPHCQNDAETYDRTEQTEHKAIIYVLGIHFLPLFSRSAPIRCIDRANNRLTSPSEQSLSRLFLSYASSITGYRNSPLVPFGSTRHLNLSHSSVDKGGLFLAQKIEVGVTAGSRIDDGG